MRYYRGTKPVIIYAQDNVDDIREYVVSNYGRIKYELPFINALCVEIPVEKIQKIEKNPRVVLVSWDAEVSKLENINFEEVFDSDANFKSDTYTLTDQALLKENYDISFCEAQKLPCKGQGEGVCIAIIDTGVNPHYDLVKPFNRILAFKDFIGDKETPYDDDGHGTHVAGLAIGNGYSSGAEKLGSAPLANIVGLKALDKLGNGLTSDILAAMQWVITNKNKYNIKVVNLSLGITVSNNPFEAITEPLLLGANALVENDITVVTAAGNAGPSKSSITSPGISPMVITVGSISTNKKEPHVASFSSRGPSPFGLHKPDIIAPGVELVSLDNSTGKKYVSQSGTSMSAPIISGMAACLYSKYPYLTPKKVKNILTSLAEPLEGETQNSQGYGYLCPDMTHF